MRNAKTNHKEVASIQRDVDHRLETSYSVNLVKSPEIGNTTIFSISDLTELLFTSESEMSTGQSDGGSSVTSKRGAFIVVEGLDRAGKTTQVKRLADKLSAKGHTVQSIRFPGMKVNGRQS